MSQEVAASLEACTDMSMELKKCVRFKRIKGEPITGAPAVTLQNEAAKSLCGLMDVAKVLKSFPTPKAAS